MRSPKRWKEMGEKLRLDQAQDEQEGSDRDAKDAPGDAGEGHRPGQASSPEGDQPAHAEYEDHRSDGERHRNPKRARHRPAPPRPLAGQEGDEQREGARGEEGRHPGSCRQDEQPRPDAGRQVEAGERDVAQVAGEARQHHSAREQPEADPAGSLVVRCGIPHIVNPRGSSRLEGQPLGNLG